MPRPQIIFGLLLVALIIISAFHHLWAQPIPMVKPTKDQRIANAHATPHTQKKITTHPITAADYSAPLSAQEKSYYKEIFTLQSQGKYDEANIFIEKIDNQLLMGHVLAQRYLHNGNEHSLNDYQKWMTYYADHPQSKTIATLSQTKSSQYKSRINGTLSDLRYFTNGSKYISERYTPQQRYALRLVKKELDSYLDRGAVTAGYNFFKSHKIQSYIDPIDKAQILATIASHYLYLNAHTKAKSVAKQALKISEQAPLAGWVMGLVSWINNDMVDATRYFTIASDAKYASPWMTSAAAYWGARAATKAKLFREVSPLLAKAVKNQRTFYGLIATKAMGYGFDYNWAMPTYTDLHKDTLMKTKAGARAVALAEIGRMQMSEKELFSLPVKQDKKLAESAIAFAHHYNLAGYEMRFSSIMENPAGGYYDSGLFPISTWTKNIPASNIALLNAFIRQESRFRTNAQSPIGALGLMQIMPTTAAYIMGNDVYKTDMGRTILKTPQKNVNIGNQYLNHLLGLDVVNNDLFRLAMAYNAGPGKLGQWLSKIKTDDPLLFIELIPSSETRAFVERIATNYWVYQMQMGGDPQSLLSVAQAQWPEID